MTRLYGRIGILIAVAALALSLGGTAAAQEGDDTWEGAITSLQAGEGGRVSIVVDQEPDQADTVENCATRLAITVDDGTEIVLERGGDATSGDLAIGQMVRVTHGAVAESCPGQTLATRVVVLGDTRQQGGNQQGGMVTKTFALTLNGEVPEGQSFYAQFIGADDAPDLTRAVVFCGELIEEEPKPACEGNGTVYTETVELDAGTELEYRFGRHNADYTDIEVFFEGAETLDADMTNSAYYTFGGGKGDDQQGGSGDGQGMPSLPNTGAGGASGDIAVGVLAVLIALAGLAGYRLRTR